MSDKAQVQVKAEPKPSVLHTASGLLQRKCACGGAPGLDGACDECRKKRLSLQRKATNQSEPATVPAIVHEVLQSPGQPLDLKTRSLMEERFGHDFSKVRIHTDAKAAESAQAVNAMAYTVGQNVVFKSNHYETKTKKGQQLLTHELTHVVQQSKLTSNNIQAPIHLEKSNSLEMEAENLSTNFANTDNKTIHHLPGVINNAENYGFFIQRRIDNRSTTSSFENELEQDFQKIASILDSTYYSDSNEKTVIDILFRWAERGFQEGSSRPYLDILLSKLMDKRKTIGIVFKEETNYYSLIFNYFDRVNEVQNIVDSYSISFRGDRGIELSTKEALELGNIKKNTQQYWAKQFKKIGADLKEIGTPTLIENLLGGGVGVIEGFAELLIELVEGVWSAVVAIDHLTATLLYFITGAIEGTGLNFLKKLPFVGYNFDPATYKDKFEATITFFKAARKVLDDPEKILQEIKKVAEKAWDDLVKEFNAADDFNKSRIIAKGTVKIGMAVGGFIKNLPNLVKSSVKIAQKIGKVAIISSKIIAKALSGVYRVGGKIIRGIWTVSEDILEGGKKRLRYFFKERSGKKNLEIPPEQAEKYVKCSSCKITKEGKEFVEETPSASQKLSARKIEAQNIYYELESEIAPYKELKKKTAKFNKIVRKEYNLGLKDREYIGLRMDADHIIEDRIYKHFPNEFKKLGINSSKEMDAIAIHTEHHIRSGKGMAEVFEFDDVAIQKAKSLTDAKLKLISEADIPSKYPNLLSVFFEYRRFYKEEFPRIYEKRLKKWFDDKIAELLK